MSRDQDFNKSSDSDELQALFDSIAAGSDDAPQNPAASRSASKKKPSAVQKLADERSSDGDDESLQALFDEVSSQYQGDELPEESGAAKSSRFGSHEGPASEEDVFNRLGHMTRQVHDTLAALGVEKGRLAGAVDEIPDARQRLNYIAQMTEQAASRVLNATDIAKPMQDKMKGDAEDLRIQWNKLFENKLSTGEFKALAERTHGFLGEVGETSDATGEQLMEIMMAQDFQDLTGQVIKRVVDLAQTLETELLELLIAVTPEEKRVQRNKDEGLLNGPVVDKSRDDVVNSQEQVDDLLDSLGF